MGFFDNLKIAMGFDVEKRNSNYDIEERSGYGGIGALMFGGSSSYNQEKSMLLSTVYRCTELISNSVGQLPFEIYKVDSKGYKKKWDKHPAFHILNCEPNVRMTRFTFMKLLVSSMLLKGNGYAYIVRNAEGNIEQLLFLPSEYVTVIPPKYIYEPIKYKVTGFNFDVEAKDMIHLLNYSYDGVVGISTLTFARNTLELSSNAENHARNFFGNGCGVGGILQASTPLNSKQKADIKQSWNQAFGTKSGGQSNGIAVLEGGFSYSPITVSAKDAQLLESRQYSNVDICRFFSVSPILAFDLSSANYSSAEMASLSFLSQTLQPILDKIELEFKRKLFREHNNIEVKFNVAELLRTDKSSQASYFREMFNIGAMSFNEIRRDISMLPIDGGDNNFVQANLLSVREAANNRPSNSLLNDKSNVKISEEEVEKEEETQE